MDSLPTAIVISLWQVRRFAFSETSLAVVALCAHFCREAGFADVGDDNCSAFSTTTGCRRTRQALGGEIGTAAEIASR